MKDLGKFVDCIYFVPNQEVAITLRKEKAEFLFGTSDANQLKLRLEEMIEDDAISFAQFLLKHESTKDVD